VIGYTLNPLTIEQFKQIMQRVERQHRFGKYGHTKWIKYVRPNFDMRDNRCFYITFEGGGFTEKSFSHTDQVPMYDEIMAWLEEGDTD
jgi:hypothetical protein